MKSILESLPNLMEQKALLARLSVLAALVFAVSYATSHLLLAYADRQDKLEQVAAMESYLAAWTEKSEQVGSAPLRPVPKDKVDAAQTGVIFNVQALGLELASLKEMPGKKEENGKSYELEFVGAYPESMQCLQNFRSKDVLIGIRSVTMAMRDGKIHTRMVYKVYTK